MGTSLSCFRAVPCRGNQTQWKQTQTPQVIQTPQPHQLVRRPSEAPWVRVTEPTPKLSKPKPTGASPPPPFFDATHISAAQSWMLNDFNDCPEVLAPLESSQSTAVSCLSSMRPCSSAECCGLRFDRLRREEIAPKTDSIEEFQSAPPATYAPRDRIDGSKLMDRWWSHPWSHPPGGFGEVTHCERRRKRRPMNVSCGGLCSAVWLVRI